VDLGAVKSSTRTMRNRRDSAATGTGSSADETDSIVSILERVAASGGELNDDAVFGFSTTSSASAAAGSVVLPTHAQQPRVFFSAESTDDFTSGSSLAPRKQRTKRKPKSHDSVAQSRKSSERGTTHNGTFASDCDDDFLEKYKGLRVGIIEI
jgi:hypothetical protein